MFMKQMNSRQYIICSDTLQDYLRNEYNSRNESTKNELNKT